MKRIIMTVFTTLVVSFIVTGCGVDEAEVTKIAREEAIAHGRVRVLHSKPASIVPLVSQRRLRIPRGDGEAVENFHMPRV